MDRNMASERADATTDLTIAVGATVSRPGHKQFAKHVKKLRDLA